MHLPCYGGYIWHSIVQVYPGLDVFHLLIHAPRIGGYFEKEQGGERLPNCLKETYDADTRGQNEKGENDLPFLFCHQL